MGIATFGAYTYPEGIGEVGLQAVIAAAQPLGDKRHGKAVKHEAIRLVVNDGLTYRQAARKLGVSTKTVIHWVESYRSRLMEAGVLVKMKAQRRGKRAAGPAAAAAEGGGDAA